VFLTAASGPEQEQLHMLCFNAGDGSLLWERKIRATGRTMCHPKTCVAAPSPASDGKAFFAFYSSNDLAALDLEGNLLWLRGLTLDYPNASNSLGMASSPIVIGSTLIVQVENDSESFAAGIDPATGLNKWKMDRPKAANWTSPIAMMVDSAAIAALQSSKGVLGVHPETGSPLFNYSNGASTTPSSVAAANRLFIPSNGMTVVDVSSQGGELKQLWTEGSQRPGTSSPIVAGDKLYTINGAGVLTCADSATGARLWRTRLKGPFSASPVIAGHFLYIFNEEGLGQCVDLDKEAAVVSEFAAGETILSTASLSDNALYIRSDKTLWKFQ
jgi:outer membrane protein assembly factor BamB